MPPSSRHRISPPANPLDDENLVAEFLLRLPPRPSSLPRAAAVCKAWRRVVTDPHFLHRFRAHHRKPPLLGFFNSLGRFFPALEAPDRVPAVRLPVNMVGWKVVACRDGLLLCSQGSKLLRVIDPMTGERSAIVTREDKLPEAIAFELVVDSTGLDGLSFRLFVLSKDDDGTRLTVAVYSSDSGAWTHSVEALVTQCGFDYFYRCPGTLVGNTFYWTDTCRILQYNLETQTLAFIQAPWNEEEFSGYYLDRRSITRDGHLGIKTSDMLESTGTIHIGLWEIDLSSPEKLVMRKTVLLDTLLPRQLRLSWWSVIGFDKENNVILLWTTDGIFMINLESMKFTKLSKHINNRFIYPYSSFVTTGMLQNPMYHKLQDMLNNMGGSPDQWDNRMLDHLKNFDLSSPEAWRQLFAQFGMTREEVVSKIMANPEVAVALDNPKIQTTIMDCLQNPRKIVKYQNDKEVMDAFVKMLQILPKING